MMNLQRRCAGQVQRRLAGVVIPSYSLTIPLSNLLPALTKVFKV
jgi:hypothetical protein